MVREQLDERLYRTTATNGLTVLSERLPGLRSAAAGVWFRSASGHETPEQMGLAHLLEHMVFKGTERRTARQLAEALEVRGGGLDAYTGRDQTSYQAHVLDQDLPLALDILTDLVRRPLLRESDLHLERNVVLEEIKGVDDTPDDLVFELFSRTLWPEHPYGYSILGTPETVERLSVADLAGFHRRHYYPGNAVIAAAGRVDHDRLVDELAALGWFDGDALRAPQAPVTAAPARQGLADAVVRDTAQAHVILGTDTFEARDQRRYALALVTNVFGGGMSSRLFQRIREELGLAYSVYGFQHAYRSSGVLAVYVGTRSETAPAAVEAIRSEFALMAAQGLGATELHDGKQQLKGQLMLALENPGSRMHRLAGFVLNDDHYRKLDDVLASIDRVTRDEVAALSAEFFHPDRLSLVILGGSRTGAPPAT